MLPNDAELLRRYSREGVEEAFAELVRRYLALVYHAALRQVGGDAQAAEDVTQKVFTVLARKARSLGGHETLAGWLHTTTRFAASGELRTARRRRAREQEAHLMQEISSDAGPDWDRLRPVIDEALGELAASDREAVLLRFFANLPLADVGARLNVSENAARMRVDRALDKLHARLAQRGVTSTTAALGLVFANAAGAAVPAGLATTVTGAALAGGGAAAATSMSITKISTGIAALLVAAAGAVGLVLQYQTNVQLREEVADLQHQNEELARLRPENRRLVKAQADAATELANLSAGAAGPPQDRRGVTLGAPGVASDAGGGQPVPAAADSAPKLPSQFQVSSLLENRYTGLIKTLNLTGPQWDQFRALLLAKQNAASDAVDVALKQGIDARNLPVIRQLIADAQAPVNSQIQAVLGDSGYAEFQHYEQTLPQRLTVTDLARMLGPTPTPLTDGQADQMVEILAQTDEPQGKGGLGRILNGNVNNHSRITALTLVRAAEALSEPQLQALRELQQRQLGAASGAGDGTGATPPGN